MPRVLPAFGAALFVAALALAASPSVFAVATYSLSVTIESSDGFGSGSVRSEPSGISCVRGSTVCHADFAPGTYVLLSANPQTDSRLVQWGGDCSGRNFGCNIWMTGSKMVTARFALMPSGSTNTTGLWWNPDESGWGMNLNQQGNTLFATMFMYDRQRAPMWVVMSNGVGSGDHFAGELYRVTASPFDAQPFVPIAASNLTRVGMLDIVFSGTEVANITLWLDGSKVEKRIRKQVFGARAASCLSLEGSRSASTNYQDLWWSPEESGWGINLTHQGNIIFATLFTYDRYGHDLWLVMSEGRKMSDGSYYGDLYRMSGPAFDDSAFNPARVTATAVGTMSLAFTDGEHGTLTFTYDGSTVTKAIVRQLFSSPVPFCS